VVAALLGAIAVNVTPALAAGGTAVTIQNFAFQPTTIAIAAGQAVTWTNKDTVLHNAVANDVSWSTANLSTGDSASITFSTAGTFPYRCSIHPEMTGTIVVTAAAAADAPATDTAPVPVPQGVSPAGLVAALFAGIMGGLVALRHARRREEGA